MNRLKFFYVFLFTVVLGVINVSLFMPYDEYGHPIDASGMWVLITLVGMGVWWWAIYKRTKDCGWHGAMCLFIIVPVANIIFLLYLFFHPTAEIKNEL